MITVKKKKVFTKKYSWCLITFLHRYIYIYIYIYILIVNIVQVQLVQY